MYTNQKLVTSTPSVLYNFTDQNIRSKNIDVQVVPLITKW
jgi:hypothetical protein